MSFVRLKKLSIRNLRDSCANFRDHVNSLISSSSSGGGLVGSGWDSLDSRLNESEFCCSWLSFKSYNTDWLSVKNWLIKLL